MDSYLQFDQPFRIDLLQDGVHHTSDGAVYKGIDSVSSRMLACKLIEAASDYKGALEQIKREAAVLQRLEKEYINVPKIYGVKEEKENNRIWLLMEWIEGCTLAEKMSKGMSSIQFLQYMEQLSEILMVLEKCKITHKDLKPDNIIINKNSATLREKVYLIDFDISLNLSVRGEGTKDYRAPEMWNTSSNVHRSGADLFSVGVIMYEYYAGVLPKRGEDYKPDPLGRGGWKTFVSPNEKKESVPKDVNDLIVNLMKYDPKQRVRNAAELKQRIGKMIKQERRR